MKDSLLLDAVYIKTILLADGALISWNDQGKFHKHLTKGQHEGVVTCVQYHPVSG